MPRSEISSRPPRILNPRRPVTSSSSSKNQKVCRHIYSTMNEILRFTAATIMSSVRFLAIQWLLNPVFSAFTCRHHCQHLRIQCAHQAKDPFEHFLQIMHLKDHMQSDHLRRFRRMVGSVHFFVSGRGILEFQRKTRTIPEASTIYRTGQMWYGVRLPDGELI